LFPRIESQAAGRSAPLYVCFYHKMFLFFPSLLWSSQITASTQLIIGSHNSSILVTHFPESR
jgi:hypothetical protein